jgi:hypothetical protein
VKVVVTGGEGFALAALLNTCPASMDTPRALSPGFKPDRSLGELISTYLRNDAPGAMSGPLRQAKDQAKDQAVQT